MAVILKDLKAHSHLNYDSKCIYMIVLPANTVRLFLRNAASVGLEGGTCLRVCNSTTQMFLWARREESLICYRSKKEFRNTVALQLNHSKEEVFACPNLWKLWKGMASLFIEIVSWFLIHKWNCFQVFIYPGGCDCTEGPGSHKIQSQGVLSPSVTCRQITYFWFCWLKSGNSYICCCKPHLLVYIWIAGMPRIHITYGRHPYSRQHMNAEQTKDDSML